MQAHKLQVKIFAQPGSLATPEMFIPVFHGWIKNRLLPELMIDVANYAHVPKGPGVVLIGHTCDYFMDEADGRLGLLHNRKRSPVAPSDRLADAFRRVLHAAAVLESEPALAGKLRFSTGEFLFRVNDRLIASNTDEAFAAVKPELEALAATMFAGPFEIARVGDAKDLLTARVASRAGADRGVNPSTLLARLGGPPV
ncbi:MAG: hypothetical protein ABUS79_05135 [Pseudomonadota bacterium]